jgi:hypothetical protein
LTGNPTAPTPAAADNDTSIATTAFVQGEIAAKAPLASPALTGTPTVPTAAQGTNTTQAASTAYVQTEAGLLIPKSILAHKGAIITATGAGVPVEKQAGTNGRVLKADSAQSDGLAWGQVGLDGVTDNLRTGGWLPTGRITRNFENVNPGGGLTLTSGQPHLTGGTVLPAGVPISAIEFFTHTVAGATLTHTFFFLTDISRVVLATTLDDTAASWAGQTRKSLLIASAIGGGSSGTYTPTVDTPVYVGICVVGTTPPSIYGRDLNADVGALAPIMCGRSSTTGITTPATLPGTMGALTIASRQIWTAAS